MYAGKIMTVNSKPTKSNIVSTIFDMGQAMDDALVPEDNRYLYMTAEMYKLVCTSDEFIGIDKLGEKSISRGECGDIDNFRIVKVPAGYLPDNCFMLATYKQSVIMPYKIQDTKIHEDPPGISGNLIEGRHYYDAFVIGAKCGGVVALVLASEKQAAPTVSISSHKVTPTSSGAEKIMYTLDGSDPRYSDSAQVVTGEITTEKRSDYRMALWGINVLQRLPKREQHRRGDVQQYCRRQVCHYRADGGTNGRVGADADAEVRHSGKPRLPPLRRDAQAVS